MVNKFVFVLMFLISKIVFSRGMFLVSDAKIYTPSHIITIFPIDSFYNPIDNLYDNM